MRFLLFVTLAAVTVCHAAWCQEVVTDEPLAGKQLIATLPLLALPKLDVDKVITASTDKNSNTWMINPSVAISSVLASDQLPEGLKQVIGGIPKGDSDIETWQPKQKEAIASAIEHWKSNYISSEDARRVNQILPAAAANNTEFKAQLITILLKAKDLKYQNTESVRFSDGSMEAVNPLIVQKVLTANRIIETLTPNNNEHNKWKLNAALDLNTKFANDIQATYYPIRSVSAQSVDTERLSAVNNAIQQAMSTPGVAATLLINLGEAGLGQPLPFTAKDKSLNVEPSLTRRYDICWIDLAFSPSEELLSNVTELRYDIAMLTDRTIALDLLPIRFGCEVSSKDAMVVPSIRVGSVEVGEMFSRTVEYKHLLPTILSHGLQTPSFGWIFTGDSLDASAKRMFAVIGVPKGTKEINTKITLEAKCREYGGFASEWASTGPTSYTIVLPQ